MDKIKIATPAGPAVLVHEGRTVRIDASQNPDVERWWDVVFLPSGPSGLDGHILVVNDCSLRDVAIALGDYIPADEGKRLLGQMPPLTPIPDGAIP